MSRRRRRRRRTSMAPVLYSGGVVLVLFLVLVQLTHGLILLVPVLGVTGWWWLRREGIVRARAAAVASARSMAGLLGVTPTEFEMMVMQILNAQGFRLNHYGGKGDRGIDLAGLRPDGARVIVQCKQYAPDRKITGPDIRSFLGAMSQHKVQQGIYVTTCSFTPEAEVAARAGHVALVDGRRLTAMASRLSA